MIIYTMRMKNATPHHHLDARIIQRLLCPVWNICEGLARLMFFLQQKYFTCRSMCSIVTTTDKVFKAEADKLISSDVIRGYNDTIILCLLLDGASYGYEISKRIRQITKEKYLIKETTLYSAFARLERNGFIESFDGDESSGRKRIYYRITPKGRAYYREKCEEWRLTQEVINHFIKEW